MSIWTVLEVLPQTEWSVRSTWPRPELTATRTHWRQDAVVGLDRDIRPAIAVDVAYGRADGAIRLLRDGGGGGWLE